MSFYHSRVIYRVIEDDLAYTLFVSSKVEFRDWVDVLSGACLDEKSHPMLPLMPMMAETITEDRTRWEIYDNMPTVHCDNTTAGLKGTGIQFADFDHYLLSKYLGALNEKQLLPEPEPEMVDRFKLQQTRRPSERSLLHHSAGQRDSLLHSSGRRISRWSAYLSEPGLRRTSSTFSASAPPPVFDRGTSVSSIPETCPPGFDRGTSVASIPEN